MVEKVTNGSPRRAQMIALTDAPFASGRIWLLSRNVGIEIVPARVRGSIATDDRRPRPQQGRRPFSRLRKPSADPAPAAKRNHGSVFGKGFRKASVRAFGQAAKVVFGELSQDGRRQKRHMQSLLKRAHGHVLQGSDGWLSYATPM